VVRGADLLDSTPRQLALQSALGHPHPDYAHLPVVTGSSGQKLGKQNHAPGTTDTPPGLLWQQALAFLGQSPPPGLAAAPLKTIVDWAIAHWNLAAVPASTSNVREELP
jgi:glutamyl-Q tRNA(Asp) synthetase